MHIRNKILLGIFAFILVIGLTYGVNADLFDGLFGEEPIDEKPTDTTKDDSIIDIAPDINTDLKTLGLNEIKVSEVKEDGSFHIYKENWFDKDLYIDINDKTKTELLQLRDEIIEQEVKNYYDYLAENKLIPTQPEPPKTRNPELPNEGVVSIK